VFIDGREGTTGLEIHERLSRRSDIELLEIAPEHRKDSEKKRELMARADAVVLCLPDAAAAEAVALVGGRAKVVDASTAHRTAPGFVYGLPELAPDQRTAIRDAQRVANPGCYPTGFLLAVRPLVDAGLLPPEYPVSVHAVSGFSGGGKKLIEAFSSHEDESESPAWAFRTYALGLTHKHVREMQTFARLAHAPLFAPAVGDFYRGMLVSVPLIGRLLKGSPGPGDVHDVLAARYAREPFVRVMPLDAAESVPDGFLSPTACNGTNRVDLFVFGREEQMLVVARLDNLGKGASGAAVQNLNLMLGADEATSLS
jgi:N-acetyl-gamma-glutamyl-phosphate reductase